MLQKDLCWRPTYAAPDFSISMKNNNIHVDGHVLFTNCMVKLNYGEIAKCCPKDPPNYSA